MLAHKFEPLQILKFTPAREMTRPLVLRWLPPHGTATRMMIDAAAADWPFAKRTAGRLGAPVILFEPTAVPLAPGICAVIRPRVPLAEFSAVLVYAPAAGDRQHPAGTILVSLDPDEFEINPDFETRRPRGERNAKQATK